MRVVPAKLVLVDGDEEIVIRPEVANATDPIICTEWNLGAPAVRDSVIERAGADGVLDNTTFTGSRTVTLDLVVRGDVWASPYAYAERLAAMTHPSRRPRLRITRASPEAQGQTWWMELRGNPFSIAYGRRAAALLELQLTFTAPVGYLEGDLQGWQTNVAQNVITNDPFVFPVSFAADFGSNSNTNPDLQFTIGGSAPVAPSIYIHGPVTGPEVRLETGERFKFLDSYTIAGGDWVNIDMDAGEVRLNGHTDPATFSAVDWSVSTFWRAAPGTHTFQLMSASGFAQIFWRDRRMTI